MTIKQGSEVPSFGREAAGAGGGFGGAGRFGGNLKGILVGNNQKVPLGAKSENKASLH